MTKSNSSRNKSARRHSLTAVRSQVRSDILEHWRDTRIVFTGTAPSCRGGPHRWKLWRRIRPETREVHIDYCEICGRYRVQDAARRRSESARGVYVRRTLFYATTRRRAAEPQARGDEAQDPVTTTTGSLHDFPQTPPR
ncbi:MAG: hypothetical protein OXF98_00940 [Rhodospirillaceae bacterium]|nr:hypothetical protein [Rhodospirillaceae bacterium]